MMMMKYDVSEHTETTHDASMTSTSLPFHAWEEDDVARQYFWQRSHRPNHNNNNHDDDILSDDYSVGVDVLAAEGDLKSSSSPSSSSSTFSQYLRFKAGRILTQYHVKRILLILIFVVLILLTVRTFYDGDNRAVDVMDEILMGIWWIFAIEVALALAFYQWHALQRGWVWLDLIILGVSYGHHPAILGLRGFKLLRVLRKATGIPSVLWAVKSILRALPRLVAVIGVLLPGMLAIFAILFTNLYQETSEALFGRIDVSAFTLFQIMTGGILWGDVYTELQASHPYSWLSLLVYVVVALFIAGTLIIAIMCDTVSTIHNRDYQLGFQNTISNPITTPLPNPKATTTVSLEPQPPSIRNLEQALQYGPTTFATAKDQNQPPPTTVYSKDDVDRLERKMDHVMTTIEQLVRIQIQLQESMRIMQSSAAVSPKHSTTPPSPHATVLVPETTILETKKSEPRQEEDDWSDYDSARPVLSQSQSTTLS